MRSPHDTLSFFAMERNLVLQAGAGTGKTHALVTLALHLLSGANARRAPVAPARLVALTFTEKAGAEMRERLQRRLAPLADGVDLGTCEPELSQTLAALSLPAPAPEFWRRLRRDVALATVGTFHSFCALQLRRFAPQAGLDPGFSVLDEEESRALFDEAVDGHVRRLLAQRDPSVRALVEELGLSDDRGSGLLDLARAILGRLSEEGLAPSALLAPRFDDAVAAARFAQAAGSARVSLASFASMPPRALARLGNVPAEMDALLQGLAPTEAEGRLEKLRALRKSFRKPAGDDGAPVAAFDGMLENLRAALAGVRAAPLGRAFIEVLEGIETRFREAKASRDALDFSDLQRMLRDLLLRDPGARRELKGRIDALLVDEFQDTSRLQLDLVGLLAESREAEAPADGLSTPVTWAPGLLCVVGDRKQSIYEFRGADVAVFGSLESSLGGGAGARTERLQRSYRSRPRLVGLVNELFRRAMSTAVEPFEVAFGDGDALLPARKDPAPEDEAPLAELLESAGENAQAQRADEADRVAARIARMLEDPTDATRVREPDGSLRRVLGRDVTLLFRRLTNLDVYRRALAARGLAHVVVGGGGFFEALEVLDAWSLLKVLDDPWDAVASAAVLRSPWCALSDPSLARLALGADGPPRTVTVGRLLAGAPVLDPPEASRLEKLLHFVRRWRAEFDRLGTARLLTLACEELNYLEVAAGGDEPQAVAANLGKLRGVLERLESRSSTPRGALRAFTERIRDGRREAGAAVAEESDPHSIRLMSIHQAKGLEFPVVFVADCGATENPDAARIAFDREGGLGLNVRLADGDLVATPELDAVRVRRQARTRAESLRLLYVAATRARDFLVFSGARRKGSWFELVEPLARTLVRHLPPELPVPAAGSPGPPVKAPLPGPDEGPRLDLVVNVTTVTATVTRLQDFAQCPEKYRLRHEVGLHEHGGAALEDGQDEELDTPLDVFARGTLAHRLLEVADFPRATPSDLRSRLDGLLRAEGHDPQRPEIQEVRDDVLAFLRTEFAQTLARLPAARRLREMPFLLCVDLGEGRRLQLKGQVDLVALTADGVRIVDYKHAHRRASAAEAYGFQLATYAVAVQHMLGDNPLPVQVGLAFLRDHGGPVACETLEPAVLAAHRERLAVLGRELVGAYSRQRWPRRERAYCDALGCGYRARCFPGERPSP